MAGGRGGETGIWTTPGATRGSGGRGVERSCERSSSAGAVAMVGILDGAVRAGAFLGFTGEERRTASAKGSSTGVVGDFPVGINLASRMKIAAPAATPSQIRP